MVRNLDNYLASIMEHIKVCVANLDDYANQFETSSLTNKDYFAIERLIQMLIESGVGLAKQLVKIKHKPIRATAFENFEILHDLKLIDQKQLDEWKSMIGLRNILIHEYLEIDRDIINSVLKKKLYKHAHEYCQIMAKSF